MLPLTGNPVGKVQKKLSTLEDPRPTTRALHFTALLRGIGEGQQP